MFNRIIAASLSLVAQAVECWPAKDQYLPTDAAFAFIRDEVPRALRSRVAKALPLLPTEDFNEAAKIIRQEAKRLKESSR
jgi:hypothetical protein